ncbi:MAG: hypothetical protein ACXWIA_12555, partial [Candidatus Aminicenantales bacterium]
VSWLSSEASGGQADRSERSKRRAEIQRSDPELDFCEISEKSFFFRGIYLDPHRLERKFDKQEGTKELETRSLD